MKRPYQFKAQCLVYDHVGTVLHNSKEEYQEVTVCPNCNGAFVDNWKLAKYQRTDQTKEQSNMSLKENLLSVTRKRLKEKALTFYIDIHDPLIDAAKQGKSELLLSLKGDNLSFMNPIFLTMVHELLGGVNVEIVERSASVLIPIFKIKYLRLSWGD